MFPYTFQILIKFLNPDLEAGEYKIFHWIQQHSSLDGLNTHPSSNKYSMWAGIFPYEVDQDR